MYCPRCKTEMFGGSVCHLCGGLLAVGEETSELSPTRGGVQILTRKKYKVSKEIGQTVPGRVARVFAEIVIFCALFIGLSIAVVAVANWLSREMALEQEAVKFIEIKSRWMRYFWFVGCGVIIFLTVKLRFKPGK